MTVESADYDTDYIHCGGVKGHTGHIVFALRSMYSSEVLLLQLALGIVMLVIAVAQLVVAIVASTLGCRVFCCGRNRCQNAPVSELRAFISC